MQQPFLDGSTKEERAVEFIQEYKPEDAPWFVGFSGGKDSVVLLDLVKKSGVDYEAYYSVTGLDAPEVTRFIRNVHPEVKWAYPKQHFFKLLVKKGYPTKFNRWCCHQLKEKPTEKIPLIHRLMGIRAEESPKRAKRGKISEMGKWTIYKPIFDWKLWEVWEYIERYNLPYSELYDWAFNRIGCVVCPFICGTPRLELHKRHWPRFYNAFESAMKRLYEKGQTESIKKARSSMPFETFLENWYRAK